MEVSAAKRAELAAALARGDAPAPKGEGKAMYIGKIKLADADGHLTPVGYAWLEMGVRTRCATAATPSPVVRASASWRTAAAWNS